MAWRRRVEEKHTQSGRFDADSLEADATPRRGVDDGM
jgi:hypothetical protein